MKKALLVLLSTLCLTAYSYASDNFDYSYVDTSIDTGYVAEVNQERPYVYYRTVENGYDQGVGASSVTKSHNYPDTSTIFWSGFEGVSGAYARSSVNDNPYDRTIHSYTATYQHGYGPTQFYAGDNWQGNPMIFAYSGPFGKAKTGGYFANTFHVEAGDSGLAQGAAVEIDLQSYLEGWVGENSVGYTKVYFGSQVFNITDLEDFSFPDANRSERWSSLHNRGELLEMYTGDSWLGLDPVLAFDNGNGSGTRVGTGDIELSEGDSFNSRIGDWLFVEGYFETITELPTAAGVATDLQNTADFDNTMHFSITPGENFSDIELVAKRFSPSAPVVPEPVSSVLFLMGAGAFAARRFKKK